MCRFVQCMQPSGLHCMQDWKCVHFIFGDCVSLFIAYVNKWTNLCLIFAINNFSLIHGSNINSSGKKKEKRIVHLGWKVVTNLKETNTTIIYSFVANLQKSNRTFSQCKGSQSQQVLHTLTGHLAANTEHVQSLAFFLQHKINTE